MLWAGLGGDTEALQGLAEDVQLACRAAGAQLEERPFHAHVTLARGRRLHVPSALLKHHGPSWPVTQVELVESVLGRAARHQVVRVFPLAS